MDIPTTKTPRKASFGSLTTLLYGSPKIGKSTFASKFPSAVFLPTEPGLSSLEVFQMPADGSGINSWGELGQALAALLPEDKAPDHPFRTLVIDTIDNAYRLLVAHLLDQHGVKSIDELGKRGSGYAVVNNEFERVIRKIGHSNMGLVMISHSKNTEQETRSGAKFNLITPSMSDSVRRVVEAASDMVLFADIQEETSDEGKKRHTRVLRCKPSQNYIAGDRTGKLPRTVELNFEKFHSFFLPATDNQSEQKPS